MGKMADEKPVSLNVRRVFLNRDVFSCYSVFNTLERIQTLPAGKEQSKSD